MTMEQESNFRDSRLKGTMTWLLKLLGIALAIWLIRRTLQNANADLVSALSTALKAPLALAVLLYGVVNWIAAWRWGVLLRVQGIRISQFDLFRLTLIGVFFSNIIPGSISGDLVKIAYLMRYAGERKAEAILTIALDRIIGLSGLFLVAIVSTILLWLSYPQILMQGGIVVYAIAAVCSGGVAVLLGAGVIAMREPILRIRFIGSMVAFGARVLPKRLTDLIGRLIMAVDLYRKYPIATVKVLLASCCIHTMLAAMNFLFGKAFHEQVMTPLQYVITTQLGNVTGLFPLTPGGMGIRDTVTSYFLNVFGASPQEAMALIPVTYSLVFVAWAVVGAIFMVTNRAPKDRTAPSPSSVDRV